MSHLPPRPLSQRPMVVAAVVACLLPACSILTRLDELRFDRDEDGGPGSDAGVSEAGPGDVGIDATPMPMCRLDSDCDDEDACTDDRCAEGRCTSSVIECPDDDDDPCTRAHCSPELGCGLIGLEEGAACDDASLCTRGERCVDGACVAEDTTVCPAAADPCQQAICDPATGACAERARDEGSACDDGDACTSATFCDGRGSCSGGVGCTGDDDNPCTTRVCDPTEGCVDAPVTDGAECGGGRTCCGGVCVSTAIDPRHCAACDAACPSDTPSCVAGACRACATTADCPDDQLDCTTAPVCLPDGRCDYPIELGRCLIDGICRADGDRDPSQQCRACRAYDAPTRWTPLEDFGCDDGLFCTMGDTCHAGTCVGGAPIRCDDLNACTVDVCDEVADTCTSTTLADGTACAWRASCCSGACRSTADGC